MEIMSSSEYRLVSTIYVFLCKEHGSQEGFDLTWKDNAYRLFYNGDVDPTEFSRWIAYQMNK